jgi:hypothetical protein
MRVSPGRRGSVTSPCPRHVPDPYFDGEAANQRGPLHAGLDGDEVGLKGSGQGQAIGLRRDEAVARNIGRGAANSNDERSDEGRNQAA